MPRATATSMWHRWQWVHHKPSISRQSRKLKLIRDHHSSSATLHVSTTVSRLVWVTHRWKRNSPSTAVTGTSGASTQLRKKQVRTVSTSTRKSLTGASSRTSSWAKSVTTHFSRPSQKRQKNCSVALHTETYCVFASIATFRAVEGSASASIYVWHTPSAWPNTAIFVFCMMY